MSPCTKAKEKEADIGAKDARVERAEDRAPRMGVAGHVETSASRQTAHKWVAR